MARFHVMQSLPWAASQSPFAETMATLAWGLQELGHEASVGLNDWRPGARHIVLCPHLLEANTLASLPPDTILYNLEQIDALSPLPPSRLSAFAHCQVWEYSERNLARWREAGIAAAHVPVGWYPGLERITAANAKDVDLLFYGVINRRRADALNQLDRAGLRVHVAQGVFGQDLDALLARTRLVVNIHCYRTAIFESVRASFLLANGIAVVSERSAETEVPPAFEEAVCWAPVEGLAEACRTLLADVERSNEQARRGREAMRTLSIVPPLRAALAVPVPGGGAARPPRMRIPQILHFVRLGPQDAEQGRRIESWRRHHPEATIRIWDEEALNNVPWFNTDHMRRLAELGQPGIAALMRWEILYREGGVAVDIASHCVRSLPDWLFDCEMFACWENEIARPGLISDSIVGAVAANPFLMALIQNIRRQPDLAGRPAWQTTGALPLTEAHRHHRYGNLTLLPSHFFLPNHHSGLRYGGRGPVYAEQEWLGAPPPDLPTGGATP